MSSFIYTCNVHNCGDGSCIHRTLSTLCPCCGSNLVEVTTSGHQFCSDELHTGCDWEEHYEDYDAQLAAKGLKR